MHRTPKAEVMNAIITPISCLRPEALTNMATGKKTREFNDNGKQEVEFWRENFADLANKHLARAGYLSK